MGLVCMEDDLGQEMLRDNDARLARQGNGSMKNNDLEKKAERCCENVIRDS